MSSYYRGGTFESKQGGKTMALSPMGRVFSEFEEFEGFIIAFVKW